MSETHGLKQLIKKVYERQKLQRQPKKVPDTDRNDDPIYKIDAGKTTVFKKYNP